MNTTRRVIPVVLFLQIAVFGVVVRSEVGHRSAAPWQGTPSSQATPNSAGDVLWRVTPTGALKDIKSIYVSVGDLGADAEKCRLTPDGLRLAAVRPILDGSLKVFESVDLTSPTLSVSATTLALTNDACAAHVSISLYDRTHFLPSYQQDPQRGGPWALVLRKSETPIRVRVSMSNVELLDAGALLTGPRSGFAERIADHVHRTVDEFVTKIKLANQAP